ncbi:hypothetical protein ACO0LD_29155 [Undibacterium sp. Ji83W]|uniref:hypothetical protein n=1 Tax=Undibacterium sp. Ji83W TaxID=3413043 RepID=UPI003BF203D9
MKLKVRQRDLYAISIVSLVNVLIFASFGKFFHAIAFSVSALVFFLLARKF